MSLRFCCPCWLASRLFSWSLGHPYLLFQPKHVGYACWVCRLWTYICLFVNQNCLYITQLQIVMCNRNTKSYIREFTEIYEEAFEGERRSTKSERTLKNGHLAFGSSGARKRTSRKRNRDRICRWRRRKCYSHWREKGQTANENEVKNAVSESKEDVTGDSICKSEILRSAGETNLLVATIIATVTFTAAFTVPGGYESGGDNRGLAVLSKQAAFKVFVK